MNGALTELMLELTRLMLKYVHRSSPRDPVLELLLAQLSGLYSVIRAILPWSWP